MPRMTRLFESSLFAALTALALPASAQTTAAAATVLDGDIYPIEVRPMAGPRADVAALLLGGSDSGALEALALAVPRAASAGPTVDYWIELDGERLLADGSAEAPPPVTLRLEVYAYAMTRAGELAGHSSRRVRVPLNELGERLAAGGLLLTGRLEIEAVETQLRLLVREPRSQRFALRVLHVAAASEKDAMASLPPQLSRLSPDTGEAWIVGRAAAAGATPAAAKPTAETPPTAGETSPRRRMAQRIAAIARSYRSVLDRLAGGASDRAVGELLELETTVLTPSDSRRQAGGALASAEEQVIKQLAGHDPESLLPLLLLHLGAHERYLDDRVASAYLLAATRERILDLAQRYASLTQGEMAAELAASALAELGVALDRAGLPMATQRLLSEALSLDEQHTAALLYLAFWHERRGSYSDAVPLLRRLIAVDPGSQQGRLRLALALRRLGRGDEAVRLLRQVIRDGGSDDLQTIAYQELGRVLLARGDSVEASRLLQTAVSRYPDRQRLYLQLAYALDRSGEGRRSREIIRALPADTGELSPRNLYSRRPAVGTGQSRRTLARHATARLPRLAQALAAIGGKG